MAAEQYLFHQSLKSSSLRSLTARQRGDLGNNEEKCGWKNRGCGVGEQEDLA